MATSVFIVSLFVFLLLLSVLFSNRAYKNGMNVRKILLVQFLSFVVALFSCSALAIATSPEKTGVQAVEQVVKKDAAENKDDATAQAKSVSVSSGGESAGSVASNDSSKGMGYIAMAICMGLACLGAGIAVAAAAPAAIGAVSEDKKSFGTCLVFVALSEGVTVFGLLIAIFIYNGLQQ